MQICQDYAVLNRRTIANIILQNLLGHTVDNYEHFETIHNYIDLQNNIIRKGAVSAQKNEKLAIHWNTYQLDEDGNLVEDQIRGDTFEYSDVFLETPNYQYVFRKVHYGSYAAQQIIEQIESHLFFNEVTYIDLNMLPPSPGFHMEGKLEICHRNSR